jgi:virginiamycin B lyase
VETTELRSTAPRNWRRPLLLTSLGLLLTATASLPLIGTGSPTTHVANRAGAHRTPTPLDVPDDAVVVLNDDEPVGEEPHPTTTAPRTTTTILPTSSTVPVGAPPDFDDPWPEDPGVVPDPLLLQFALPNKKSYPQFITAGPDGAMWFSEENVNTIGRMTTDGELTEYHLPDGVVIPMDIVVGPDGALWFLAQSTYVGRLTVGGQFTIFNTGFNPYYDMVVGPDGALWYTAYKDGYPGHLVRITTGGDVTSIDVGEYPRDLTVGPDGNLWMTDGDALWRITPDGGTTEFPLTGLEPGGVAQCITVGPDGALWFGYERTGDPYETLLVRRASNGDLTSYDVHDPIRGSLIVGPDGNFWATSWGSRIMRITPSGVVRTFDVYRSSNLAVGPDGNVWFTNDLGGKVGRVSLSSL